MTNTRFPPLKSQEQIGRESPTPASSFPLSAAFALVLSMVALSSAVIGFAFADNMDLWGAAEEVRRLNEIIDVCMVSQIACSLATSEVAVYP